MSERHNFSLMLYTPYNGLYLTRSLSQAKKNLKFNIQKTDKWKFFGVLSMNGIKNYPAAGEIFLENVILKVSQTHFSKDFHPKGGCEVPWFVACIFTRKYATNSLPKNPARQSQCTTGNPVLANPARF